MKYNFNQLIFKTLNGWLDANSLIASKISGQGKN
jgi:hypothetical protein